METLHQLVETRKIGLSAFTLQCLALVVDLFAVSLGNIDCFTPQKQTHTLAWQVSTVCIWTLLAGGLGGVLALFLDRKRAFGIAAIGVFLPFLLVTALAEGCN